jgi:hypothetical protein
MSPICIHFLKFSAGRAGVTPGTVASLERSEVSSKYCTSFEISTCRIVGGAAWALAAFPEPRAQSVTARIVFRCLFIDFVLLVLLA